MKKIIAIAFVAIFAAFATAPVEAGDFFFGLNRGFNRGGVAVSVNGRSFRSHNNFRFNNFGTRTVVDRHGRVFEVDAFGNSRFRGSAFNRGFSAFGAVGGFNHGFNRGFNRGFNNGFGNCNGFNSGARIQNFNTFRFDD